ncbi:MAG: hypothetical protein ABJB66_14970 [Gemmatimonadaceae bacterium]
MISLQRALGAVGIALLACGANSVDNRTSADERTAVLEMRSDGRDGGMGDIVGLALRVDSSTNDGVTQVDTSVVVGSAADAQIVKVGPHGELLSRIGRKGAALGEYVRLQWVGTCNGEQIVVHDIALSRLSNLDAKLNAVSAKTIPKVFDSRDVAGCLPDGRILILNDSSKNKTPGVQRKPLALVALDTKTGRADTLNRFRGTELNYVRHLGTFIAVPLGAKTHVSLTGDRLLVAESNLDSLWRFENGKWSSVALEGIPAAKPPLTVDDQRARQALAWAPRTQQDREFAPGLLAETSTALMAPRIDAMVGADDGGAWIGLKPGANGQRDWIEYNAQGKRVASTRFVWTFEPRLIRGASWWGIERDSIGVETVVRYRVNPKR